MKRQAKTTRALHTKGSRKIRPRPAVRGPRLWPSANSFFDALSCVSWHCQPTLCYIANLDKQTTFCPRERLRIEKTQKSWRRNTSRFPIPISLTHNTYSLVSQAHQSPTYTPSPLSRSNPISFPVISQIQKFIRSARRKPPHISLAKRPANLSIFYLWQSGLRILILFIFGNAACASLYILSLPAAVSAIVEMS